MVIKTTDLLNAQANELIEVNGNHTARFIMKGQWLYDGVVSKPVRIFALNYDFYFDLDEGSHDDGPKPKLNRQRVQYVVVWHDEPFFSASDFPSNGFVNVAEAKEYAISVVQKIEWQDPVTEHYM